MASEPCDVDGCWLGVRLPKLASDASKELNQERMALTLQLEESTDCPRLKYSVKGSARVRAPMVDAAPTIGATRVTVCSLQMLYI